MKTLLFIAVATLLTISSEAMGSMGWESHSELFAEVSVKTGVEASELATIAAIESSFRPWVKAKASSATGLFQFTDRTWRVTLKSYGEKYGLDATADRKDPMANALMGAEYIKENRRVLKKKMGRYPSLADVYMAHLIAPRRVAALEDINPKASMAYLYPNLAKHNRNLFYKKNGTSRSVSEFKKFIGGKVWRAYNKYVEPAKLAVAEWKRAEDAKMFAAAMQYKDTPWTCAENINVRTWGAEFAVKSLAQVESALGKVRSELSEFPIATLDNGERQPEPYEGKDDRILYLDRRLFA